LKLVEALEVIGSQLKLEMEKQSTSCKRLAKAAGCSPETISRLRNPKEKKTVSYAKTKLVLETLGYPNKFFSFDMVKLKLALAVIRRSEEKKPAESQLAPEKKETKITEEVKQVKQEKPKVAQGVVISFKEMRSKLKSAEEDMNNACVKLKWVLGNAIKIKDNIASRWTTISKLEKEVRFLVERSENFWEKEV